MNYKIVSQDNKFNIFEVQTDQIIMSFDQKDKARQLLRHFNFGGSFDGWTPTFFLKDHECINKKSHKA